MPFLDEVHERVVIFDGAVGTNLHLREPSLDDYGGPAHEGCVDILTLTRPDIVKRLARVVLRRRRRRRRDEHLRCVRHRAHRVRAARPSARDLPRGGTHRGRRPRRLPGRRTASLGRGLDGPRHQAALARPHLVPHASRRVRGDGPWPHRGRRRPPPHRDLLRPLAGQGRDDRRSSRDGGRGQRRSPIQMQVTMETTGRMLVGSEIGAALASLRAMKPDLFGLNCATGPARDDRAPSSPLRSTPTLPISVLPNAGLPSVVHGHTHYDLTPEPARRPSRSASSPSSA